MVDQPKYGRIAESERLNEFIYHCFQSLKESEIAKFVNEFHNQPHDKTQVMHTLRELILGAYLSQLGLQMTHNYIIDAKTPDWCAMDETSQPKYVIELVNFHPDTEMSADIVAQIREKGIWCNFVKPNTERIYHAIWEKASKYKSLVSRNKLPYIVSVFGEFTSFLDEEEINQCLFDEETGLFELYPEVSGLLYFEESFGIYYFTFKPNPFADSRIEISSGTFR